MDEIPTIWFLRQVDKIPLIAAAKTNELDRLTDWILLVTSIVLILSLINTLRKTISPSQRNRVWFLFFFGLGGLFRSLAGLLGLLW
jgi:hypothetical protein